MTPHGLVALALSLGAFSNVVYADQPAGSRQRRLISSLAQESIPRSPFHEEFPLLEERLRTYMGERETDHDDDMETHQKKLLKRNAAKLLRAKNKLEKVQREFSSQREKSAEISKKVMDLEAKEKKMEKSISKTKV